MATQPTFFKNGIDCSFLITFRVPSATHPHIPSCRPCGLLRAGQDPSANQPLAASTRREPYAEQTRPGRCPEQELIALRPLMINQAREVFCQRRFPPSLIYVADREPTASCPVDSYAASLL